MHLPVFYRPQMVASPASYSPSASKPREIVEWLERQGLPIALHAPEPVTEDQLARAHDRSFVRGVLAGRLANGFGDRSPQVAASLPFTTGAMLAAARHAIATRAVAFAPCSGFHHAGYARAADFCTFNGLMVTACALRAEDGATRIGVLDCDMHFGDGTEDILDRIGARSFVTHFTAGRSFHDPSRAEELLALLPSVVRSMGDCDVILYQAGADPHVDDPLGGLLDDGELRRRDDLVFRTARAIGVPVAWNLAGGYRRDDAGGITPVLRTHEATARACLEAYA